MELKHKLEHIKGMLEEEFRKNILMPLFVTMGYQGVREYHGGVLEKGKDILFWDVDKFGYKEYFAVVVKKGDITGSVSDNDSAKEVLYQVQQCFDEPFTNVYDLAVLDVHKVIIVASGEIKKTAIESIKGQCKKSNLDKFIRFIDGQQLIPLINQYLDYFSKLKTRGEKDAKLEKLEKFVVDLDQTYPKLIPPDVLGLCISTSAASGDSVRATNIFLGSMNIASGSGISISDSVIIKKLSEHNVVDVNKYIKCDVCSRYFPKTALKIVVHDGRNVCFDCLPLLGSGAEPKIG